MTETPWVIDHRWKSTVCRWLVPPRHIPFLRQPPWRPAPASTLNRRLTSPSPFVGHPLSYSIRSFLARRLRGPSITDTASRAHWYSVEGHRSRGTLRKNFKLIRKAGWLPARFDFRHGPFSAAPSRRLLGLFSSFFGGRWWIAGICHSLELACSPLCRTTGEIRRTFFYENRGFESLVASGMWEGEESVVSAEEVRSALNLFLLKTLEFCRAWVDRSLISASTFHLFIP